MVNKVGTDAKGAHVFAFLCSYQLILNIKSPCGLCGINITYY